MTPLKLEQGRADLSDPTRYTTGAYARNASGDSVISSSPEAEAWCSLGKLNQLNANAYEHLLLAAASELGFESIGKCSDHSHEMCLRMWDKAIDTVVS